MRIHPSVVDLAREVGVEETQVHEVLARLTRLHIVAGEERGGGGSGIVVKSLPRLLEFLEFLEMPRRFEA